MMRKIIKKKEIRNNIKNIYNTNLIQNENPNINQTRSYYKVQSEQEIPSIQEDENQMKNNFTYT